MLLADKSLWAARSGLMLRLCRNLSTYIASNIVEALKARKQVPDLVPTQPIYRYLASWLFSFEMPCFVNDSCTPFIQIPHELASNPSIVRKLQAKGWQVLQGRM